MTGLACFLVSLPNSSGIVPDIAHHGGKVQVEHVAKHREVEIWHVGGSNEAGPVWRRVLNGGGLVGQQIEVGFNRNI